MRKPELIYSSDFLDERGSLRFFPEFDMQEVLRFYEIKPATTDIFRAWQGHKVEKKWFYCLSGSFVIYLIKLDNFEAPSTHLVPERFILSADLPYLMELPAGYVTGIKSTVEGSRLLVFSNFSLNQSKMDDFRYPVDQWDIK